MPADQGALREERATGVPFPQPQKAGSSGLGKPSLVSSVSQAGVPPALAELRREKKRRGVLRKDRDARRVRRGGRLEGVGGEEERERLGPDEHLGPGRR